MTKDPIGASRSTKLTLSLIHRYSETILTLNINGLEFVSHNCKKNIPRKVAKINHFRIVNPFRIPNSKLIQRNANISNWVHSFYYFQWKRPLGRFGADPSIKKKIFEFEHWNHKMIRWILSILRWRQTFFLLFI